MMSFKKNSVFVFLIFICSGFSSIGISGEDWQLKKSENGISVYTRKPENSDFKEVKASAYLKTSLSSLIALLYDFEFYPKWVYKCGKSGTLKVISEKELIHYQTVLAPWPIANRDFVVNIKIAQNKMTKVITIKSHAIGHYIPAFPGYVRIMNFNASWVLTPLKNGNVEIVYTLLVDPAGNVPAWAVNMAIIDGPFETMANIKELVLKEKYQKTKSSFILEPD